MQLSMKFWEKATLLSAGAMLASKCIYDSDVGAGISFVALILSAAGWKDNIMSMDKTRPQLHIDQAKLERIERGHFVI